ncbi:MAG: protein kinase [Thiobacillus sp.]|nr:protein kinase [Thiobacillus sp.]
MPALNHAHEPGGLRIGRYEVLDEIGQGAMGTVHRARDPLIERTVAIKVVPIAQLQQEGADAESRFLREAQSAGRLSHPNIVTIYDVGEADGLAYIAMEYLPGVTLRDIMNRGPLPLDLALDTAAQMASALAFAHEHGVIHRDIKPANVVVTGRHGRVKLTDFGIAHLANSDRTQTGQMLGSPRYMSPEQAMGRDIDGRADIFSLGAVLYEMLTGHYAFDGESLATIVYRVIHDTPPAAEQLRPGLPAWLNELLASMLNKHPENRPDARTLVKTLHALSIAPPPPLPAVVPPPQRVPRLLAALAFGTPLGVLLLIGVGIILVDYFLPAHPVDAPASQVSAPTTTPAGPDTLRAPDAADAPPPAVPSAAVKPDPYLAGLDKKQVELRILRTELLLQYTDQHPDVVQVDRQLEQLRSERRRHLRQQQAR